MAQRARVRPLPVPHVQQHTEVDKAGGACYNRKEREICRGRSSASEQGVFQMDEEQRKTKRLTAILFLACLCIALACFGAFAYLAVTKRGAGPVDERIVTISKIAVMTGIFFLVLAFGYLLPASIAHKKRTRGGGGSDMSEIFDEMNMRNALAGHIPDGETLLAGIHAVAKETEARGVFGKCVRTQSKLLPDANGSTVALSKTKYSTYDVYLGITRSCMVIAECEENDYLYRFEDAPDTRGAYIREVTSEIDLADIGTCFPLADIQSCELKKGWMGSIKCSITMKDGSYLKLMLPKLGGLGGGMPHHTQYREAIVARLSGHSL